MERIISVGSDRNIWEHLCRWSNLIGPTEFLSICQIVVPISVRGGGAAAPPVGKKIVLFGQN